MTRVQDRSAISTTCRECGQTWYGTVACHCPACHRTFPNVGRFDTHRPRGKCTTVEADLGFGFHEGPVTAVMLETLF